MLSTEASAALDEVSFLRRECLQLVSEAMAICPPDASGNYPDPFRNVVTPFLYAVWERCFTTNFGIMAKLVRATSATPLTMSSQQIALWLKAEPFFASLATRLKNQNVDIEEGNLKRAIKGSTYRVLAEFVEKLQIWQRSPVNVATETSSLVMTFSNVNLAVLDVNAEAIGLADLGEFIDFRKNIGRLEDLVGRRNDIGHGTFARPPQNREFQSFLELTNVHLISEFCDVVQTWIVYR